MNKKYVSDLYDPSKLQSNKLNVIYAPMGSGKTHLFKKLLIDHDCLMIAPYRTSRDDFGLAYNYNKYNNKFGLRHEFLYTDDLMTILTNGWANTVDLTDKKAIEAAVTSFINSMPIVSFTHILFDEVDFMWLQSSMNWIGNKQLKVVGNEIWEYLLKALATKFILIGQTSTVIPSLSILPIKEQILEDAYTSVRFDSITPVLVHKDVTHPILFKEAMERSMMEAEQLPTLVYKRKFSVSDINTMNDMVKKGKRVLVVLREENSPKQKQASQLLTNQLTLIGAVEVMTTGITKENTHVHFKVVGFNTALNQITPNPDPYEFFDYLFVNTSSSRQVSLKAVRGDKNLKVRAISIGQDLENTSHQVGGRFRENRVEIIHYLKGKTKDDPFSYSEFNLWHKLLHIDPLIRSYMNHGGVKSSYSGMSGLAKTSQKHIQSGWIPKTVKGQAKQKTKHRNDTFNKWFKTLSNIDLAKTNIELRALHESYFNKNGAKPYSKNPFAEKLKEAKKKTP